MQETKGDRDLEMLGFMGWVQGVKGFTDQGMCARDHGMDTCDQDMQGGPEDNTCVSVH